MKIKTFLFTGFLIIIINICLMGYYTTVISTQVSGLRNTELPMSQSLGEVEVNIWEAIHAADAYRLSGNVFYKELYEQEITQVDVYLSEYAELADTPEEKQFLEEFNAVWEEAIASGNEMMNLTEQQKAAEDAFFINVDEADDVLDFEIQGKWQDDDPYILEKERAVREVEVSIWEAIHAGQQFTGLSSDIVRGGQVYVGSSRDAAERGAKASLVKGDFSELMERQFEDVEEYWTIYKALPHESFETEAIEVFDEYWEDAVDAGRDVVELHNHAEEHFNALFDRIDYADDIIDYKMQEYIKERIEREDAISATNNYIATVLAVAGSLIAIVLAFFIYLSISDPLRKLEHASREVSSGNFDLKVDLKSRNEFGKLSSAFDKMIRDIKARDRKLKERNAMLENLDKEKDEFISIAAHELKTPLTSIKGFNQLMLNDNIMKDKKKRKHYLDLVNQNTIRLYNLIMDLVDSSRLSLGKLVLKTEEVNVREVFNEIRENMEIIMKEKGIRSGFSLEERIPSIRADKERVLQVLRNLLINSIHYTESGGMISLRVQREGRFVQFDVQDTGQGIPKEHQNKIFSRFYQVDASLSRKIKGSGLGLSICKGLVDNMGGRIWFESEEGKGSTFHFTLPVFSGKQSKPGRKTFQ